MPQRNKNFKVIVRNVDDVYIFTGDDAIPLIEEIMTIAREDGLKYKHINREKIELRKTFAELNVINKTVYKSYKEPKHARRLIE